MSSISPKTKAKPVRHPPPTLFLGPPSRNVSQISISNSGSAIPNNQSNLPSASSTITPQRSPLPSTIQRQRSQLAHTNTHSSLSQTNTHGSSRTFDSNPLENMTTNISAPIPSLSLSSSLAGSGTGEKDFGAIAADTPNPLPLPPRPQMASQPRRKLSEAQKQTDRTEAQWAEMQSTLEEVDLSASYNITGGMDAYGNNTGVSNGGMHVFGPEHGKVLEELRFAQMELAKAWARSEGADEEEERRGGDRNEKENMATGGKSSGALRSIPSDTGGSHVDPSHVGKDASFAGKSTAHSGSASAPGNRTGDGGRVMEQETKSDILLARKRREANDRYFKRVNEGVLDVVGKLEEVARAMRVVEKESRDIWGEEDSVIDGSMSVVSADR